MSEKASGEHSVRRYSAPAPATRELERRFRRRLLERAIPWTVCLGICAGLLYASAYREQLDLAVNAARDSFRKDLVYRLWVTERAGVYVPADSKTPPNPYLANVTDRDLTCSNGKTYTLVNPAYMTRMVHALGEKEYGLKGHITSLKPLRPENAADPWEVQALHRFESGEREVWELVSTGSSKEVRFMGAFLVQPGCLRCHAHQGYRVGDVRGGISVSVPMGTGRYALAPLGLNRDGAALGAIWLLGMCGLVWLARREHAAEREAESAHELRHAVFQAGGIGLIIGSPDHRILDANPSACTMLGYSRENLVGQKLELLHGSQREFLEFIENFHKGGLSETSTAEWQIRRHDGSTVWCTVSISRIDAHEESRGFVWGLIDTSTLRDTQESLIATNRELTVARDQALSAARIKADFLANTSHEIRTPLHGILGMVELLHRTTLTPEQAQFVSAICRSGDGLLVVLNDILDYSKLEAGQLHLESVPFSLSEEAGDVVSLSRSNLNATRVKLELGIDSAIPARVVGDATRFRQVLNNLLSNAVKFTEEGRIGVHIALVGRDERSVRIRVTVSDTGIGISPEQRKRLFLPFSQADSSTARRYGGTGLGLMLVKRLVETMGGSVAFQSQIGVGSEFVFELPLALQSAAYTAEASFPVRPTATLILDNRPARILIVEDVLVNQLVARKLIESAGALVTVASSGAEALEASEKNGPYDLILMDCQMPEMDGYTATARIRDRERSSGSHVPIIAMTAGAMAEDRQRCLDAGMDDYVSKPVTGETLVRCISDWLARSARRGDG